MPNAAEALDWRGCAKGAYALLFRAELAQKVLFLTDFSSEIFEKVGIDEESFLREISTLHGGDKAAWVKFLQELKEQDSEIRVYLSNCSTREQCEAKALLGDDGSRLFLNISPFSGHEICVYKVPDRRIASDPMSPEHMLARIAAKAGVIEPGERAVIVFSSDNVFGIAK